jgi:glycosyltransferase involved in cell wall biosynthesis
MIKSTKKLSFILPCHNVEKYVAECLDSLYNQDIPETDYEVICVNDCSPDGTRGIIVEYQQQHNNLILIDHEVNKKQGGARNTGLIAAQGEYIWFIDPDDYIVPNCLKKMLEMTDNNQLDILFFNFDKIDANGTFLEHNVFEFSNQICEGKELFLQNEAWGGIANYPWTRITQKKILIENNIFFYESFSHEDEILAVLCFLNAHRIQYFSEQFYFYRQHFSSALYNSTGWYMQNSVASRVKTAIDFHKIATNINDGNLKNTFEYKAVFYSNSLFKQVLYMTYISRMMFYEKIKEIDDLYILYDFCDKRTRIALKNKCLMDVLHTIVMPLKKLITALRSRKIIK